MALSETGEAWEPNETAQDFEHFLSYMGYSTQSPGELKRLREAYFAGADVTDDKTKYVDIVFDGSPGPEAPRFVEVENSTGASIRFGEWLKRPDGYWVLRIQCSAVDGEVK
jgi:hypothetical protein